MDQRTESIFQELKKNSAFDFNQAVKDLMSGKKLTGEDGVLTPLIKELVETALCILQIVFPQNCKQNSPLLQRLFLNIAIKKIA
jgi:hypothetical protein